jgi:hypothetical protein
MLYDVCCQFENNLFVLLLFEGIGLLFIQSISLQRALVTHRAGLQNKTPTTTGAWCWYEMS